MSDIETIPCDLPPEEMEKINELMNEFYDASVDCGIEVVLYAAAHFLWAVVHQQVSREQRADALELVCEVLCPEPDDRGMMQ